MVMRVSGREQAVLLKGGFRIDKCLNPHTRNKLRSNEEMFIELYNLGYTYPEIMRVMNVKTLFTIRKWVRVLNLPKRESGNYSRRRRKERGK